MGAGEMVMVVVGGQKYIFMIMVFKQEKKAKRNT